MQDKAGLVITVAECEYFGRREKGANSEGSEANPLASFVFVRLVLFPPLLDGRFERETRRKKQHVAPVWGGPIPRKQAGPVWGNRRNLGGFPMGVPWTTIPKAGPSLKNRRARNFASGYTMNGFSLVALLGKRMGGVRHPCRLYEVGKVRSDL